MLYKSTSFFQKIPSLLKSHKGSTLIEFVFVFPILITLILTALELGVMLAIKVNLQSCAVIGANYGQQGTYATGSTRTNSAIALMQQGLSGFLTPSKVTITIQSFPSFLVASTGIGGSSGTGNPGQVGQYTIQYAYSPATPPVAAIFGSPRILTATTYGKNAVTFPP